MPLTVCCHYTVTHTCTWICLCTHFYRDNEVCQLRSGERTLQSDVSICSALIFWKAFVSRFSLCLLSSASNYPFCFGIHSPPQYPYTLDRAPWGWEASDWVKGDWSGILQAQTTTFSFYLPVIFYEQPPPIPPSSLVPFRIYFLSIAIMKWSNPSGMLLVCGILKHKHKYGENSCLITPLPSCL